MKKIVVIIVIVLVVLLGALLAIPIFFKQNLLDATKSTINKYINAEVEFADMKLSLFQNFPKATLEFDDVLIIGENEFKNDTLLNVSTARVTMSLSSLFKKSGISIDDITLDKPTLNLVVNAAGNANWDLIKSGDSTEPESANQPTTTDNSFKLQLDNIEINDATFLYRDNLAKMAVDFLGINFGITGKMYGSTTELITEGKVDDFNLNYSGVDYISNTSLQTKMVLNIDYETMTISIAENELFVNNLALELTGNMEIPSDSTFFDLQLKTKKSDFKNFLELVPAHFNSYLKDIKTGGSASVTGKINGFLFGENYPAFSLSLDITNGIFQYEDFPESIKNIKADVDISKVQGDLNLIEIKVNDAHFEIKNNPVDLTLAINNLVKDPWFDGAFIGKINFDHLKDVIPLDSVNIAGLVDANLFVKGNYSAVENEEYDKIKSDGIVLLDRFIYDSPKLSQSVFVAKGQLDFSPKNINLKELKIKVGQSDFNLSGKVFNYLNYFLKDGKLKGTLGLKSNFVNINELLRLQIAENKSAATSKTETDNTQNNSESKEVLAFNIPENLDIAFRSNIKKAVFDQLPISNINGLITAKNGKLILNGLNMQMLDGELYVNGSYKNTVQNQPFVDFGFNAVNIDIPLAYKSLSGIRSMIPVAGNSRGKFSTEVKMRGQLTPDHKFIPASINGSGQFSTQDLQIIESPIFNQLRSILKPEKLVNVKVDDFKANFDMENGNIQLKPFKTKVAGQETSIKGELSVENLINMRLDFIVKRDAFGSDIQNILGLIPGNQNIKELPAGVIITGPVGNPKTKMDLSETRKSITNATKDDLQKTINKIGSGLRKLFK
ncbi:MAG: AsmA family protein [Draconibacterium sp.]|nr:AsmA family protein [Draconibacterium sp.]